MRGRYPSPSTISYSFGPGGITPAVKALILANVALFVTGWFIERTAGIRLDSFLGLRPVAVVEGFQLWQPVTYLFLHGGFLHIVFNMLALWMFGVELERTWGTRFFLKYYMVTGVAAGFTVIAGSLIFGGNSYVIPTIGASGAVYGILLAYALYFPNRPIYLYFVFPVPAKYFVMIVGAMAFFAAADGAGSGVSHAAHLGGLVAGFVYLKGARMHVVSEIQYRFLKWRINRMRRRFDVHAGGRADDVDRRVH